MRLNRILFPSTLQDRWGSKASRATAQDSLAIVANVGNPVVRRGKRQRDRSRVDGKTEYVSVLMTLGNPTTSKVRQKFKQKRTTVATDSLLTVGQSKENKNCPSRRTKREKLKPIKTRRKKVNGRGLKRSREDTSLLKNSSGGDGFVKTRASVLILSPQDSVKANGLRLNTSAITPLRSVDCNRQISKESIRTSRDAISKQNTSDGSALRRSKRRRTQSRETASSDESETSIGQVAAARLGGTSGVLFKNEVPLSVPASFVVKKAIVSPLSVQKLNPAHDVSAGGVVNEIRDEKPKRTNRVESTRKSRQTASHKTHSLPKEAMTEEDSNDRIPNNGLINLGRDPKCQNSSESLTACAPKRRRSPRLASKEVSNDGDPNNSHSSSNSNLDASAKRVSFRNIGRSASNAKGSEKSSPATVKQAESVGSSTSMTSSPEDLQTPRRSARLLGRPVRFSGSGTEKGMSEETGKSVHSAPGITQDPSLSPRTEAAGIGGQNPERKRNRRRRSSRNRNNPDRFGTYASEELYGNEKSMPASAQAVQTSKPASSQAVESQPSTKSTEQNKTLSLNQGAKEQDDCPWQDYEVTLLREAHNEVDPTSFSFWEEVSELIGTRTTVECREKWFSLVKTPKVKAPKSKKNPREQATRTPNDDDIFNATPMKAMFSTNNDELDQAFGGLQFLSNLNVGSAVKVDRAPTDNSSLPSQRGYKTYISNMRRNVLKADKRRKPRIPKMALSKSTKNVRERAAEGDIELDGRLSPGGTIHVKSNGDEGSISDATTSEEDETEPP